MKSPSKCNEPGSSPKIESKIPQFETEGRKNSDEFNLQLTSNTNYHDHLHAIRWKQHKSKMRPQIHRMI